jgi:hypothetical protein
MENRFGGVENRLIKGTAGEQDLSSNEKQINPNL